MLTMFKNLSLANLAQKKTSYYSKKIKKISTLLLVLKN